MNIRIGEPVMQMFKFFGFFLLSAVTTVVFAEGPQCPAVDCDCEAFIDSRWRNVCKLHEREVFQLCADSAGTPQSYCRLSGPSAKPVALSVAVDDLPRLTVLDQVARAQLLEEIKAAEWSLLEDLKFAERYLESRDVEKLGQMSNILDRRAKALFRQHRLAAFNLPHHSTAADRDATQTASESEAAAAALVGGREGFWSDVADRLMLFGERMQIDAGQAAPGASAAARQVAFKFARLATTSLEYSARTLAEAGRFERAAAAMELSAGVAEQLTTRAIAVAAPKRHLEYYREQAAARWHLATYYWSLSENREESLVSFQNAEQVLNALTGDSATSEVAGAEDEAGSVP